MKICFYSPYFPNSFGGGEKYLLDAALITASNKSHQVSLAISSKEPLSKQKLVKIKKSYQEFMGQKLIGIEFINTPLGGHNKTLKKLLWTKNFDVLFYSTDGSLFFSLAKKNILHIQIPLKLDKSSFIQRQKLKNWHTKTTNSEFTKSVVEPSWPVKVDFVHQPMVDAESIIKKTNFSQKREIILNVGRFFTQLHSKRQDILVKIFKKMISKYKRETKDWQLVLIGSVENADYAQRVHKLAQGLPVKILHDVSRNELIDWFTRSSIYWHATGYRINDEKDPEKLEHFGITTVEAMAAGNVPIVLGKGGQVEVVGKHLMDWTWLTQESCVKNTIQLIRHPDLRSNLQKLAQQQAQEFSPDKFADKLQKIIT